MPRKKPEPPPGCSVEEWQALAIRQSGSELRQGRTPSRTLVEIVQLADRILARSHPAKSPSPDQSAAPATLPAADHGSPSPPASVG